MNESHRHLILVSQLVCLVSSNYLLSFSRYKFVILPFVF